tara:strand:+ start:2363 stop:2668 length:306 start_codon:yes stop_codon:yes gene_type:complete
MMNNWRDVLKDAGVLARELEAIMNKPVPNYQGLKTTLVNIQRSFPQVFRQNENVADMRQMVDQMIDEAEMHYRNTRQLQVKNLEEQLRSVSDALSRIEELE